MCAKKDSQKISKEVTLQEKFGGRSGADSARIKKRADIMFAANPKLFRLSQRPSPVPNCYVSFLVQPRTRTVSSYYVLAFPD